jgi:precorrin-6A/cobalt-precorrin-6A reductase
MTLLLLGGTSEAKRLAGALHSLDIDLIYSIAGLVRAPQLNCELVSGGFRQFGGLDCFIKERSISAILDVTHPYAQRMSQQAVLSANNMDIPCWRFNRPLWEMEAGDDWHLFSDWPALLLAIKDKKSVFFSAGQLPEFSIDVLNGYSSEGQQQLLRTAVNSLVTLPINMQWIKSIGPFEHQSETNLLIKHTVDCLVSKNSGGLATKAKILAARKLGMPVYMLKRPQLSVCIKEFEKIEACEKFVSHWFNKKLQKVENKEY